jgi:hypothetical protein
MGLTLTSGYFLHKGNLLIFHSLAVKLTASSQHLLTLSLHVRGPHHEI